MELSALFGEPGTGREPGDKDPGAGSRRCNPAGSLLQRVAVCVYRVVPIDAEACRLSFISIGLR